jgi:hypothetical protein
LGVATEVDVAMNMNVSLSPRDQSRGWNRRWLDIQAQLERLVAPRNDELSGEGIHAAARELRSFYIQTYHLKDALKAEATSHGVTHSEIEAAITGDPELALLADLANLDKHHKLTASPRSGAVPHIVSVQGTRAGSGEGGWRLEMKITHHQKTLDGLELAQAAVAAWRRHLKNWGLI